MNFAVVEIAGKQYLVQKGDTIKTPTLPAAKGEQVTFTQVLLHWDGETLAVGRPLLDGFAVAGRIIGFSKAPKVIVYKYKRRKDSHRKMGHRQGFCTVEIEEITPPGKGRRVESEEMSPPAEKKKPVKKPAAAKGAKKKTAAAGKKAGKKKTGSKAKPKARKKAS